MKAVLLIDIPDDLTMEDLDICGEISSNRIDDGWVCELSKEMMKPMPNKDDPSIYPTIENVMYATGWNDCLKEIEGETE